MAGVRILYVGVSKQVQSAVSGMLKTCVASEIQDSAIFFENLEKITDQSAEMICIGGGMPDLAAVELAQALRMQAPNSLIFYIDFQGQYVDVHKLTKNGCNEIYYLPVDEPILRIRLHQIATLIDDSTERRLEAVPLVDLEPNEALDFESSIYLPMNNKYITINRRGQAIKESHFNRMKEQAVSQIFIPEEDLAKFLSFSAKRLKALASGGTSTYESKKKLQSTIRTLFQDLLSSAPTSKFEEGKEFVSFSQKIVAEVIGNSKAFDIQKELAAKLSTATNDLYDRSGRVSTVAALFSMATGLGKVESVSIAALFMDFGLGLLPPELLQKDPKEMTAAEMEIYAKHPADSVKLLQERKMVLTPEVLDGILQHHERFDAQGFPKKLPHHRIGITAQILYIADQFVSLSEVKAGQAVKTPLEIISAIQKDPGASPEVLKALRDVFSATAEAKPA